MRKIFIELYISTIISLGTLYFIFIYPFEFKIMFNSSLIVAYIFALTLWILMFFSVLVSIQILTLFSQIFSSKKLELVRDISLIELEGLIKNRNLNV